MVLKGIYWHIDDVQQNPSNHRHNLGVPYLAIDFEFKIIVHTHPHLILIFKKAYLAIVLGVILTFSP